MYENIVEIVGKEAGQTSVILVGVHGNERCGIDAILKILPDLNVRKGRVIFAYGNPRAIEQNVRFVDSNLNRMFKPDSMLTEKERTSYEYGRAQFLRTYLDQADVLLDVHASNTPASLKFVICEQNARDVVRHLPFPLVVFGFDGIQPGGTDYYMNQNGKVGICVECGYLGDPLAASVAEESILAFLAAQGNIDGNIEGQSQAQLQVNSLYMTKSDAFRLSKQFEDFEGVLAGQPIGTDGSEEVRAETDGVILFARNRDGAGEEAFVFGKYLH